MDLTSLLRKLKPILGETATRQAWEQLQLADPKTAKIIEFSLRKKLAQFTGHSFEEKEILLEPLPKENAGGQIPLGVIQYGRHPFYTFSLRASELIQHTAIFGRSGAGKTNVAFLLLRELSRHGIPFLVFDWKKNYRDLLLVGGFSQLVVYTVGRNHAPFFFNPLIPPKGVQPREWLKKLIEIMQHAYFLGEGVAFVLQEVLDQLYRTFGIYESSGNWPTFRDLLSFLRSRPVKGREAAWMESALRAVGVLCFGAMDRVLNSGPHFPVENLLKQKAVLELDALTNSDKTFLIESLLLWIHHYRMQEPGRERLKHVLLVEEAHHVLLKKKQELTGAEAVTDVILREVREFGEAIILLDQLPSLISKPALENTFTTIAMNLKEKGDVTSASKAMLLESEQAKYLGRLPVGQGIVKLQARWPKPFLVKFPLFSIRKGVAADQVVKDRYIESIDVKTAARMMNETVQAASRMLGGFISIDGQASQIHKPIPAEMEFLKDVHENLASPVTERYTRLGLNPKKGTELVTDLLEKGFLRSANIPLLGTHVRLFELTSIARNVLGLPNEEDRLGSLEHRFWVEKIYSDIKKSGLDVKKEAPLGGGRTVDILVSLDRKRIGIEVETGKSDWKRNVKKCLEAGLNRVIVAGTRMSTCRAIEKKQPLIKETKKAEVTYPTQILSLISKKQK